MSRGSGSRTTESVRWRGGQVTRIEALTDAVFGFAITLLVVSLEVPATFDDLLTLMRGFLAFAFSFALLVLVWYYHYSLFSRYDLEDGYTVVLNSVLLFVVLFYVYPLKFVASFLLGGQDAGAFSSWEQVPTVMSIYAVGFTAVFTVFGLLYLHAYRIRDRLGLTDEEVTRARASVANCGVMVGVGVLSLAVAQLMPGAWAAPLSGFTYFLIAPLQYVVARRIWRERDPAVVATADEPAAR